MPLDPKQCRLASPEQVGQFNELETIILEVSAQLPRVAARAEFKGELDVSTKHLAGVLPDLKKLSESISRDYYQVGLLGVTGAGKSTSLNSLIGQKVLPQGSEGMPCTSVIQRIRFVPATSKPSISMVFLSQEDWWTRRKMLCDELNLTEYATTEDDTELLSRIQEALNDPNTAGNKETAPLLKFFSKFLQSGSSSRQRLNSNKPLGPIELPDLTALGRALESVASHKEGNDFVEIEGHVLQASECALLREVFVGIPLERPPAELELVDLPGFLAKSGQDDIITKSYLDRLDGACFLLNTQNLGFAVFDEYRNDLIRRFKSLLGRVWLVASKIDSLAEDQIHSQDSSIFHGIDKAVRNWNLHEPDVIYKHLLITSNEIFKRTRGKDAASVAQIVATALKMDLDDEGRLPLPQPLRKHEQLQGVCRAFQHVLEDGGIGRFRDVVQVELAKNVRIAVAKATRQAMFELANTAIRNVEACRDQRGLTDEDHTAAISWSNNFRVLQRQTDLLKDLVGPAIANVKNKMLALLEQVCPQDNLPAAEHLQSRHSNLSASIGNDILKLWNGKDNNSPGGVIGEAIIRLQSKARELAKVENLESRSRNLEAVLHPLDTLKSVALELIVDKAKQLEPFTNLDCPILFKGRWPAEITPKLYRDMMIRKIDNVIYEASHRLQNVLRSALEEVELRLERLRDEGSTASTDSVSRETYEQFIEKLRDFQSSLDSEAELAVATN